MKAGEGELGPGNLQKLVWNGGFWDGESRENSLEKILRSTQFTFTSQSETKAVIT